MPDITVETIAEHVGFNPPITRILLTIGDTTHYLTPEKTHHLAKALKKASR